MDMGEAIAEELALVRERAQWRAWLNQQEPELVRRAHEEMGQWGTNAVIRAVRLALEYAARQSK